MTLALRRFRLDGIGPPGARFDPLAVDLTTAGGTGDAAKAAILFLENGGGKSVLLRLLFAVVLPGRRHTVGSVKLDGYVGSNDTGHVALEWQTAQGPLVTGLVLEWRNRTRSANSSNLVPTWYAFSPRSEALTLDELPTRDGDRRVTRTGFRDRLGALAREHPQLQLVVEDSPSKWAEHLLRATPLDPETFRYQRQMNADEADAESLFSGIRTDEDFVRFVVEAAHDPEQVDGFGDLLDEYAAQLGRRTEHEAEARFCAEAAAALRPFGSAYAEHTDAGRAVRAEAASVDRLRARLVAGAAAARSSAAAAAAAATTAAERANRLDGEAKRVSAIGSELRRCEAELRLRAAEAAEQDGRRAKEAAERLVAAWEAVGAVVEARRLRRELAGLQAAQEEGEHELAPLREAAERAEALYAGRLHSEAVALDAESAAAVDAAGEADRMAGERQDAADAARARAGELQANADGRRDRVREVADDIEAARAEGLIGPGEAVAAALDRVQGETERAAAALRRWHSDRTRAASTWQRRTNELADAKAQAADVAALFRAARTEHEEHQQRAAAILAAPRVHELAPGAEDAWVVAGDLAAALDQAVREAEATERTCRAEVELLDLRLERLDHDGLFPPPADVQRVWDAVVDAGVPATTGWRALAQNRDPEGRARALATNPALAGGVVVTDPARLGDAVAAVSGAGVQTDNVVVIGIEAQLDEPGAGHAVAVRPALYDPEQTEQARAQLAGERADLLAAQAAATQRLAADQPLLDQVRELVRRCPPTRRDELVSRYGELGRQQADATATVERLEGEAQAAADLLEGFDDAEQRVRTTADHARDVLRRLDALATRGRAAEQWEREGVELAALAQVAREDAGKAATDAATLRGRAEHYRRRATETAAGAERLRTLARTTSTQPVEPPPTSTTDTLAGDAAARRRAYDEERAGRDLTVQLTEVEARLGVHTARLAGLASESVAEAERLADGPGAGDPETRAALTAEARRSADERAEELSGRTAALGAARKELRDRTPADRPRHVVLPPELEPVGPDEAARRAAEHQVRFTDLTEQFRLAQAEAGAYRRRQDEASTRARLLAGTVDILPEPEPEPEPEPDSGDQGEPDVAPDPWDGAEADAAEAARSARAGHEQAIRDLRAAEARLAATEMEVRRVGNDPAFTTVAGVRIALAGEPTASLAGRAGALAGELDDMRRSIEEELADARRHREGIVQRLATLVEGQLRQLRLLTRMSRMPDGLGGWTGKPFLSVDFEQVSGAEVTARLGPVVDDAVAAAKRRPPLDVVLSGMRAAVLQRRGDTDRTFAIRLLRPNRTMTYERATIAELESEFSGGMKLTAAICTYCTLAALRANTRSTGLFGVDPGPLFLDNPLGKASADYLLELQHRIAEKLGVQLVHTTGVWDVEALATYQRVVRLRNLTDVRRNLRRLRVDDDVSLPGTGVDAVAFTIGAGD